MDEGALNHYRQNRQSPKKVVWQHPNIITKKKKKCSIRFQKELNGTKKKERKRSTIVGGNALHAQTLAIT